MKLLLAALLIATSAAAGERADDLVGVIRHAGLEIELYPTTGVSCTKPAFHADFFPIGWAAQRARGCWMASGDFVLVQLGQPGLERTRAYSKFAVIPASRLKDSL